MEIIKGKLNYLWLAFAILTLANLIVFGLFMFGLPYIWCAFLIGFFQLAIVGIFITLFVLTRKTTPLPFFYLIGAGMVLLALFLLLIVEYVWGILFMIIAAPLLLGILNIIWASLLRKTVKTWRWGLILGIVLAALPIIGFLLAAFAGNESVMIIYMFLMFLLYISYPTTMFIRGLVVKNVVEPKEATTKPVVTKTTSTQKELPEKSPTQKKAQTSKAKPKSAPKTNVTKPKTKVVSKADVTKSATKPTANKK